MGGGVNLESNHSPITYCVSWGQFLDLSKLQFLHLLTGGDNSYHPQRAGVRTMHGRQVDCVAWHKVSPQERDANSTMVHVSCDARLDKVAWSPHSPRNPLAGYLGLPRKMLRRTDVWTSLVVQWLRTCLPMKGPRAPSLVPEGPTLCGGN